MAQRLFSFGFGVIMAKYFGEGAPLAGMEGYNEQSDL